MTSDARQIRTSLAHLTMIEASPLQLIEAAAAGGFDGVGMRIVAPQPTDTLAHPLIGDDAKIRDVEARLKATGVAVFDVEVVWLAEHTDVATLKPALELGQRLGARHLLVCGNDAEPQRLETNLARLCELADAHGLGITFEFMPFVETKTLQQALTTLARIKQPNARLLVDALHLFRSGGTIDDITAIDPALLPYLHLCDALAHHPGADGLRAEARGGRFYPGEGALPLGDLLRAMPAGLPVAIEAPCARYAGLSFAERGRICGAATRAFLSGVRGPQNWA